MSRALKKDATYADLCAVPDNFVAEILGGELYVSPRPASPHAHATGALFVKLVGPFQEGENGPGGWWFLSEPELHFGADVLVPDIAGWRRERMPTIPNVAFFTQVPDWMREVRLESRRWSLMATYEGDAKIRAEPFAGVDLPLRALWLQGTSGRLVERT